MKWGEVDDDSQGEPMNQDDASAAGRTPAPAATSDDELEALQWVTAQYYLKETNFLTG